jgi:class 3 adenylate cyclase
MERKLTAILCADVHGYSRLMGEDEEATLRTLSVYRKIIDSLIEGHHGRFVNSAGDSVLAEFTSVVEAVNCAVDIQTSFKAENGGMPPERRMEFRIGVNLGDVMLEGEQIYGDGVNVAARLENLAEPGGICISSTGCSLVTGFRSGDYEEIMNKASCLSLLSNAVLVWNTMALINIVTQLRTAGETIPDQDLARISPLMRQHVIPNGTYHFARSKAGDDIP